MWYYLKVIYLTMLKLALKMPQHALKSWFTFISSKMQKLDIFTNKTPRKSSLFYL